MDPVSFLGGTLLGAGTAYAARKLQRSRRPTEGLGDLLGWAFMLDEGIMLLKDGSFLAGATLNAPDLATAPAPKVNRSANVVHEALALLGEGFSLEVNVHRQTACSYPFPKEAAFPSLTLEMLEAERRDQFTRPGSHFATACTVLVTYAPPREYWARWEHLIVRGGRRAVDYDQILERFKQGWAEITAHLGSAFNVQPLDSKGLIAECQLALTARRTPSALSEVPHSYLSSHLASCDFETGFYPVLDGKYVLLCTLTSLGTHTRCLAGDFFNRISEEARWHMRFVALSRHAAERRIRRLQTGWFHQRGGLRTLIATDPKVMEDQDALEMQEETGGALAEAKSGRARFGYFINTVVLRDESLARGRIRAQALLQTLRDQGFGCMLETVNATDALIGSLPGHGFANLRRPLMTSRNVAHLFPVSVPWRGDSSCPNPLFAPGSPALVRVRTSGATPFDLNLYQEDVGHTLVVGATGAGKSVLVGFLAMNFLRYANSRVHIIDLGHSHQIPCLAAAGAHFDFGSESMAALQPLRHLDTDADRMWALSWLEAVYDLCRAMPDATGRRHLSRALELMQLTPRDYRSLTALHLLLPLQLQDALEPYIINGPFGLLLDGDRALTHTARMQVYELGKVLKLGDAAVVPLIMTLLRRIERSLDGTPTLIVIEEAWAALLRSRFAARIQEWLLTLRKHNAAVVIVAHSPAQISALPNAALITESCPTKIILPNPEASSPETAPIYRAIGLNAREIKSIASARRKQDYFYKGISCSRQFELALGPAARALLMPAPGMNAQEYRVKVRDLTANCGNDFLNQLMLLHS
ncbi:MAG: hypothetical protein OXU68_04350 [Bacteroidota bacterium]|nr:hypothetical protein [Bacteroidota bacterium]